jgi:hypothetical protein
MPKKIQKGGILIKSQYKTAKEAFDYFLSGCEVRGLSNNTSNFGLLFYCRWLRNPEDSPYETLFGGLSNYSSGTVISSYKTPVTSIIIKIVGIYNPDISGDRSWIISALEQENSLMSESDFENEINIQTDIYYKTLSYLDPICPAPVYGEIIKDKTVSSNFVGLLSTKTPDDEYLSKQILINLLTNILDKTIPFLGVLAMELGEGYLELDEICENYIEDPSEENELILNMSENMSRLRQLELAVKTGYIHNSSHGRNILINHSIQGCYKGMPGRVLLIDFGSTKKIPPDILKTINVHINNGKYYFALMELYKVNKLGDLIKYIQDLKSRLFTDPTNQRFNRLLNRELPVVANELKKLGWLFYLYKCGLPDGVGVLPLTPTEKTTKNLEILELNTRKEDATDERIAFFNNSLHAADREKYPLLPLSNAIKNRLFEGVLSGGKPRNKSKTGNRTGNRKRNRTGNRNRNKTRSRTNNKTLSNKLQARTAKNKTSTK